MPEPHQIIDDITPRQHDGSVTLSSWSWAVHRYTMGALLWFVVVAAGIVFADYLQTRKKVNARESKDDGVLYQIVRDVERLKVEDEKKMALLSRLSNNVERILGKLEAKQ